jgi:hypothetical protein
VCGPSSGKLPPEVIQGIVRAHYPDFRRCYEVGLARDATLTGRVSVRFVIGRDGRVSNVCDGGSDMPDQEVAHCVSSSFYGLKFPAPQGGVVTVLYPIMLQPS